MQGPLVAPPQPPRNLSTLKGLATTQIVIGMLSILLGIIGRATFYGNTWVALIGTGIWSGIWFVMTGIIGIRSARNYMDLNGNFTKYMVFNIISTIVSGLAGLFAVLAVIVYANADCSYDGDIGFHDDLLCEYRDTGLGVNIPMVILMTVIFIVSICSAVKCCQGGGGTAPGQVIIQQPVVVTTGGQMVPQYGQVQPQYPPQQGNVGQYGSTQYPAQYPPQQANVSQYPQQQANVTQYPQQQANVTQYPQQQANVTQYPPQQANIAQYPPQQANVAHSEKPPAYTD